MRRKFFRRAMAVLLLCTMLTGQLMVGEALAAWDIPVISQSTASTEPPESTSSPEGTGAPENGSLPVVVMPQPAGEETPEGDGLQGVIVQEGPSLFAAAGGGLSVSVISSQTEVKDGDKYSFTVSIADSDLMTEPNIKPGDKLEVKLPGFLTASDMDAVLRDCFAYFEKDYTYDKANHSLTLTFKPNADGAWINVQFSITMQVSTIGYDGDGQSRVEVSVGNMGTGNTEISVDTGSGSGGGETQTEPYLEKRIWSNYKLSQYGVGENSYVMRDPDTAIGYAVAFGVKSNYTGSVMLTDDLSGGNLTLCDKDGAAGVSMGTVFRLSVGGQEYSPAESGGSLVYSGTPLGTVTISLAETGFTVTCQGGTENTEAIVDVLVRYYAKVTGNANDITNSVSLSVDGTLIKEDSQTIRRYDNQGLVATKSILSAGGSVGKIDISEEQKEVTFRIVLTQYGTGSIYKNGDIINFDALAPCFRFDAGKVTVQEGAPFRLEADAADGQKINIVKDGDASIASGVYTIDFTVGIDQARLGYGQQATNTVGSTVAIRRMAKLQISKTWLGENVDKGQGAKFALYNGRNVVAETEMSTGESFVLYLNADKLRDGRNEYILRETTDENNGYMAARDMTVVISKTEDAVTIVSIDGVDYNSGLAELKVENKEDSGKGSLVFKKTGGGEALDGGIFELYRAEAGGDALIEKFTTAGGEKRFEELPYGSYYVKEISAPEGYLIQGEGKTGNVTLKKTAPHQSLSLDNTLYQDGGISIAKADESGNVVPGAVFTLTRGGKSVSGTTGADGTVSFGGLAAGDYMITETLPEGYTGFTGPLSVKIDTSNSRVSIEKAAPGASAQGSHISIKWINTQLFGSLSLTKYGPDGDAALEGAEFALFCADGSAELRRGTTGPDGRLSFSDLAYGKYLLKEIAAPEGYVISDALEKGVSVSISSVTPDLSLRFINQTRKGSISITKTDADSGAALSGAVFGLYSDEAATVLLEQKSSGADGTLSFTGLEAGKYYVKEISAPTGYQLNTEIFSFELGTAPEGEESLWAHSRTVADAKRLYALRIIKRDDVGTALSGAEFALKGMGISRTAISDKNGLVSFPDLPFGTYTITETRAPDGFVPAAGFEVTVDGGNTPAQYSPGQTVDGGTVTDKRTSLSVLKVDDKDASRGLPGTRFVIKAGERFVIAEPDGDTYRFTGLGDSGTEFVTGEKGSFILEYLPLGSYTLVETAAPDGYVISKEETAFKISGEKQSVTVGNTLIKASLRLEKTDENGKLLPGVGFTLKTAAGFVQASGADGAYSYTGLGEEPAVLYTGVDGVLHVDGLLWGSYTLDEDPASTPEGLVPETGRVFSVTESEHQSRISLALVNSRALGSVEFRKLDDEGAGLQGAVFMLENVSGGDYAPDGPLYAVSGADGTVRFEKLPYGVYKLTEYLAPYGKELSGAVYYVSVGGAAEEGLALKELPFDWVNEDTKKTVTFRKVSTDGRALAGAVFRILAEDGETVVLDMLTVNSPEGESVELPLGRYWLEEISAPLNYVGESAPVFFEVTMDGLNRVTMKNAAFTGSLSIVKTDAADSAPLSGAEFKVFGKEDYILNGAGASALYTVTTNSDGRVSVENIPFGDYAVVEVRAPQGYELCAQAQYFSITNAPGEEQGSAALRFENEKSRYIIEISKVDIEEEGRLLPGAVFAVSGQGYYAEAETGADGRVSVQVPAPGEYSVTEIKAPQGYTLDPQSYAVHVTAHSPEGAAASAAFTSRDYPSMLRLLKIDQNGEPLDGAVFEIISAGSPVSFRLADGAYVYDPAGEISEIPVGSALIKALPEGDYILRETQAPERYMALGDIEFSVDPGLYDKALTLYAENLPHLKGVAVCKEDQNGRRLSGAAFTLYDGEGRALADAVSSAGGYALFENLGSGSYVIRETGAPEGYKAAETAFAFEIGGAGEFISESDYEAYNEGALHVFTLINEPVEHAFRIRKTSAESGAALSGARFRLLGAGIDSVYETGDDGLTERISIPIGEYTLTEIKAPQAYQAEAGGKHLRVSLEGIEIDGAALPAGEAAVYEALNKPADFSFAIQKIDGADGKPLAGAVFTVKGQDGSRYSLVSGDAGLTDRISLAPGTYAVTEAVAPEGYRLPLAGWSFTVDEGSMQVSQVNGGAEHSFRNGLLTLTLKNTRSTGSLMIYKHDAGDEELALEKAVFKLLRENGAEQWFTLKNGVYTAAEKSAPGAGNILTSNAMGRVLVEGLETGSYTLREIAAPEGYAINAETVAVKLTERDETVSVKLPNQRLLKKVSVYKQSAGGDPAPLMGAVFALYSVGADGSRNFVSEAVSLYDGRAEFTVPYGDYIIVETRAPAGYELSGAEPWRFSYNGDTPVDEAFSHTFSNEKSRYALEIYKHDEADSQKALAGAEFAVTDSRGFTRVIRTGTDGIARLEDLRYDDYTIREVTAPEGYYLSGQVYSVDREDLVHGKALRIDAADEYILGALTLRKLDRDNGLVLLEGAEFAVYDKSGAVMRWNLTEDGYQFSAQGETEKISAGAARLYDIPAGRYSVKELKAPEGYLPLDEERSFTISAENARAGIEIEIENILRRCAVGIVKMDAEDQEKRLQGAEFTLYKMEDGVQGESLAAALTDENGLALFSELPMGQYRLLETRAPEGYKLWNEPVDFEIDGEGRVLVKDGPELPLIDQVYMAGLLNEANKKELILKKVSSADGTALPGASFTLQSGERTIRVTTGEDGLAKVSLPYGEYAAQELIAPDGYVLDEGRHIINVSETGISVDGEALAELSWTVENRPVEHPLRLHKQDASGGAALSGAEFSISGGGTELTLRTNASGDTDTVYLRPGEYSVTETKAPSGYIRPISGWTLTVSGEGRISVKGEGACVALGASAVLTLENSRESGGSNIAKTGQSRDSAMLLGGAALMLASFTGLMAMLIAERKRRRSHI